MRMTEKNWNRPFKITTIRTNANTKEGIKRFYCGSRFKPKFLGEAEIGKIKRSCMIRELRHDDAVNDGFDDLIGLLIELAHLNKDLTAETVVNIYPFKKVVI